MKIIISIVAVLVVIMVGCGQTTGEGYFGGEWIEGDNWNGTAIQVDAPRSHTDVRIRWDGGSHRDKTKTPPLGVPGDADIELIVSKSGKTHSYSLLLAPTEQRSLNVDVSKPDTGFIVVDSNPSRANVFIDGKKINDKTDTDPIEVKAFEKHTVKIRRNGYNDHVAPFSVRQGETLKYDVDLIRTPICGNMIIDSSEVCDTSNHGALDCTSFGFTEGDLACCLDCGKFDLSGCRNVTRTCTDNDGGGDDQFFVKSNARFSVSTQLGSACSGSPVSTGGGGGIAVDSCSGTILKEAYCTADNTLGVTQYDCPHGCHDGACIEDDAIEEDRIYDTSTLGITTTPTGARIIVDQSFIGFSPQHADLDVGEHIVYVQKTGYYDNSTLVVINSDTSVHFELVEIEGFLDPCEDSDGHDFSTSGTLTGGNTTCEGGVCADTCYDGSWGAANGTLASDWYCDGGVGTFDTKECDCVRGACVTIRDSADNDSCVDTDGGHTIFIAGSASADGSGRIDGCRFLTNPNGTLQEAVCDNGVAKSVDIICPSHARYCNRGVCSPDVPICTDTDGADTFTRGTIVEPRTVDGPTATDYCQKLSTKQPVTSCSGADCGVREFTCTNPFRIAKFNDTPCAFGCSSGACIPNGTALWISSTPSGGDVFIDSNPVGRTPVSAQVSPGPHHILVNKSDYVEWRQTVSAIIGRTTTVHATLVDDAPSTGSLSVQSTPSNAQVYVDGQLKGVTPLVVGNVAVGNHKVTVALSGYQSQSFVIRVVAGQTKQVVAHLVPAPGETGALQVYSTPRSAAVLLDGSFKGYTPWNASGIRRGVHILNVTKIGYQEQIQFVDIKGNETTIVKVALVPLTGNLFIRSEPTAADIFVDGQFRGRTNWLVRDLNPGTHSVELRRDGFLPFRTTAVVVSGQSRSVDAVLQPQNPWCNVFPFIC